MKYKIKQLDFSVLLRSLKENSVDLILTDPPYTISRKSNKTGGIERYNVETDFGDWDWKRIDLKKFSNLSYRALRKDGTIIVFYDIWKISYLAKALKDAGFSKLRFIEWIKTNPVPINSKKFYLANTREVAIAAIKGQTNEAIFNSEYDGGVYYYPIAERKSFNHPTKKPVSLFTSLVLKHSNKDDLIVDPFLGSGTTAVAALSNGRKFIGGDTDKNYYMMSKRRVKNMKIQTSLI